MNTDLQALKLVLDHLGVGTSIKNVSERKEKQKAIYLAKVFGIDLGYSYGWYVKGPYSPSLTKDYYELQETNSETTVTLRDDILKSLESVKNNFVQNNKRPAGMQTPEWLELLASWHYLRKVSKYSITKANEVMSTQKSHLSDFTAIAEEILPTT